MRTTHRAFTLVELLVVVTIFVLLAALLFPVLASVREQGRKRACADDLHQLYLACALYAEDHDHYLPPYDARVGGADSGPGGQVYPFRDEAAQLVACLQPYIHSQDIWFCPSDPFAHTDSIAGNTRHQFLSYLYGGGFQPYDHTEPRQLDAAIYREGSVVPVIEPTELILFVDSSALRTQPVAFYSHNGQFNKVYFDGHISAIPSTLYDF